MRLFSILIISLASLFVMGWMLFQGNSSLFLLMVVPAGMFVMYKLLQHLFRRPKLFVGLLLASGLVCSATGTLQAFFLALIGIGPLWLLHIIRIRSRAPTEAEQKHFAEFENEMDEFARDVREFNPATGMPYEN